jgi:hypothetical protein
VSTGSPGSGVEVMTLRVLDAMGIDPKKDIKQERLGAAESVNAIKDRKIDAFFWVGGVPTAALTDLAATPGIKMKLIDHGDYADAMNKKYGPLYVKTTIAPHSYAGQDKAVTNIDVWNISSTSDKMSDQMAYTSSRRCSRRSRARRRAQGSENIDSRPGDRLADPVPSGAKKYSRAGRQGRLTHHRAARAHCDDGVGGTTGARGCRRKRRRERLQTGGHVHRGERRAQPSVRGRARESRRCCSSACRCSTCTPRSRSFPRRCCARSTSAGRCCSSSCCSRSPRVSQPADVVGRRLRRARRGDDRLPAAGGDDFWDRNTLPNRADVFFGVTFVLLVLEAVRRTSGWIMLFVIGLSSRTASRAVAAGQWAHRGYDVSSLSGFMYQTLEGIFGTAVDVSSSLIILFTIYGAFLQHSGAGKFYLDWSFAAMGSKHSGAGAPSCWRRSCSAARRDRVWPRR